MSRKIEGESRTTTGGFQLRKSQLEPEGSSDGGNLPGSQPGSEIDQLGELPHSYGSDTIFLVAQEPHWLFTYWDIDISRHPGGPSFLRVYQGDDSIEAEIEVPFETRNWYIPVKFAGGSYTVEIGYYRANAWQVIAKSVTIQTPSDKLSESQQFDYATIPLHLSFQKLVENVQSAIQAGETLIQALSRLQKQGAFIPSPAEFLPDLAASQRAILESILGAKLIEELSSGSLPTTEIEARIRTFLEEKLSSAGASELMAGGEWSAAGSSLFSALTALSSAGLSSWGVETFSSWAASALTSWSAAAQAPTSWSSASLGSWSTAALGSWSQAAQASWGAAILSSWFQAAQSSWLQAALAGGVSSGGVSSGGLSSGGISSGGETSWAQAAVSSWLTGAETSWFQAAQSSWAQAALSSWSQAALTSWSQAALSSWAGGSESASSFGQATERKFFMNVNAEVIFYGGTDPSAKVTIDGKPIALSPDGTFRYHFVFPDGTYEIPIVAISPDGVETRSATLRFERTTAKSGQVDDTPQPPFAAPIGASS